MENIEAEPELEEKRSYITIEEQEDINGGTNYLLVWRGHTVKGDTIHEALDKLSSDIKELG